MVTKHDLRSADKVDAKVDDKVDDKVIATEDASVDSFHPQSASIDAPPSTEDEISINYMEASKCENKYTSSYDSTQSNRNTVVPDSLGQTNGLPIFKNESTFSFQNSNETEQQSLSPKCLKKRRFGNMASYEPTYDSTPIHSYGSNSTNHIPAISSKNSNSTTSMHLFGSNEHYGRDSSNLEDHDTDILS